MEINSSTQRGQFDSLLERINSSRLVRLMKYLPLIVGYFGWRSSPGRFVPNLR